MYVCMYVCMYEKYRIILNECIHLFSHLCMYTGLYCIHVSGSNLKKNLSDIPILNFLHHLITGAGSSDGLPDALTPERQERGKERGRE